MLHLRKNRQKISEQEQYLDYVSHIALPALKQGNVSYVNFLLRVFTIKDAKPYHIEIADLFVELLAHTSVKGLIRLDEECRCYPYDVYTLNWQDIDCHSMLSHETLSYLSGEQYAAILRLGTFHSNGYFRQMCMEKLAQYPDNLPFL